MLITGFYCSDSLGKPSTGSVYFGISVLVMLYAMGSAIACNGVMDEGNKCVNSFMVL